MMEIPMWIILIVVFFFGWLMGVIGTFWDMQKNPKPFYENYIKRMIAKNKDSETHD